MASGPSPRVAVVVPCHDDGATLPDALASVERQERCELVVVDDGSQDSATLAVLAELEQRGVHVLHQANAGPAEARMAGVRATSAPYVFPLDADDELAPGALPVLADALDAHPDAVVAWGEVEMFGSVNLSWTRARSLDAWQLTYVNEIPGTSLVRRSALLAAGGWTLRGGYEDWDLWMSFAERGWKGVYVRRPMLRYRIGEGRMWRANLERHAHLADELRQRHPALYAARARNWRASQAPWRAKLLFPAIERLPLVPEREQQRLYHLVSHPVNVLRSRLGRRRR